MSEAANLKTSIEPGLAEARPGESDADLRARVWPVWEKALAARQSLPNPIALVTHGAVVGLLLKDLGVDESVVAAYRRQFDHSNPVPPAGVWKAVLPAGSARWQLELVFMPSVEPVIL